MGLLIVLGWLSEQQPWERHRAVGPAGRARWDSPGGNAGNGITGSRSLCGGLASWPSPMSWGYIVLRFLVRPPPGGVTMPWSTARGRPEPEGGRSSNPLVRGGQTAGTDLAADRALGVLLAVLFATGSCRGVDIPEEQASRPPARRRAWPPTPGAFTPKNTEAQVLRQGVPCPDSMWVVVFHRARPRRRLRGPSCTRAAVVGCTRAQASSNRSNVDDPGGG